MSTAYTCAICGRDFVSNRSVEDALAEYRASDFASDGEKELGTVCDPCYQEFMGWWKQGPGKRH